MMREVRIHDDDEAAGCGLEPVHISCTEAEFAFARPQDNVIGTIEAL